jgi:DNA-damage-inducible protein D
MADGNGQLDFDSIKQVNPYGQEYWSARELAPLLGYARSWENFEHTIERAKIACEESGNSVDDHFHASMKMVRIGSKASREIKDYLLSRLACYLIAMNGNARKKQIADAQLYFAIKTRKQEIYELREEQEARIETRQRVSESYKMLGAAASDAGVNSSHFGIFIDSGYLGLHGLTLEELKARKDFLVKRV